MLFKIIGSIMIITSSSFLGYFLSRECAKRPEQLRELQSLLQVFENEVVYMSNLLADAFYMMYEAGKTEVSIFFKDTADNLKNHSGLNACTAWEKALEKNIGKTALNKEDKRILVQFGKMLGNSDVDGQQKNIKLAIVQLGLQEKKSEELKSKNEAMYKRLGVLCGLAIVIILM